MKTKITRHLIRFCTVCANGFDPHQDQRSFGSDLDPNCLQRLSADKCFDPYQDQCSVSSDLDPNCLQRLSADNWFRSTSGPNVLSVLIWIQTVCKGYQQTKGFDPHQDQCSVGSDQPRFPNVWPNFPWDICFRMFLLIMFLHGIIACSFVNCLTHLKECFPV